MHRTPMIAAIDTAVAGPVSKAAGKPITQKSAAPPDPITRAVAAARQSGWIACTLRTPLCQIRLEDVSDGAENGSTINTMPQMQARP